MMELSPSRRIRLGLGLLLISAVRSSLNTVNTIADVSESASVHSILDNGSLFEEENTCDGSGTCLDKDGEDEKMGVPSIDSHLKQINVDDEYKDEDDDYSREEDHDDVPEDASSPNVDNHELCKFWSEYGECTSNPTFMLNNCMKSCESSLEEIDFGVEQTVMDIGTEQIMNLSNEYMRFTVMKEIKYRKTIELCKNNHELCSFWASSGECEANEKYMKTNCAVACRSCEMLDVDLRCPLDPDAVDALHPGDLDELFERITDASEDSEYARYEPVVHSRPGGDEKNADILDGPWVVTFESFLLEEECDRLIYLAGELGYERSTNVGKTYLNGTAERAVSNTRTSTNAWCTGDCSEDPVAKDVESRISNILGIPTTNQENFQLLKYEVGQFYASHHDFIPEHTHKQPGARILTFYLYLNDVEQGGGTGFTDLQFDIMPKKGRALLWPSVQNGNPLIRDSRTHHEAKPVETGTKYGANAWVHMRDFKGPNAAGCI